METLKNYVDWKLAHSDKTTTAEGYPLVMENCKTNKKMKQLEVYGDCFQRSGSKNLLPYPYSKTTATINGVTFTDNGDGSITVNGTATANAVFYLYTNTTTLIPGLKNGDTITVSLDSDKEWEAASVNMQVILNYYDATTTMREGKCVLSSSTKIKTTTITDDWCGIGFYIVVVKNSTVDNITLRVQIELGTTSTEYEPYVLSPSPDYPSEIETVGDLTTNNLFDMETILPEQGWIKQDDGSYYVESAATSYQQVLWENTENYSGQLKILYQFKYLKASSESPVGVYISIKYTDGTSQAVYLNTGNFDANTWYTPTESRTISNSSKTVQSIAWAYGTGRNSTWVKDIMITKDITATEYEPYHKYKIPIVVRGKNLFDKDRALVFGGYLSGTSLIQYKESPIDATQVTLCMNCQPNTTYIASRYIPSQRFNIASSLYSPTNNISMTSIGTTIGDNKLIRTGASDKYLYIYFYNSTLDVEYTYQEIMSSIQVEKGSTATEYEPYVEPITQNIYLDEPLRKIEDYADYIDFKNKRVVRNIFKDLLNIHHIYKKATDVVRFDGYKYTSRAIPNSIILSYIFPSKKSDWIANRESIFNHATTAVNWYWSIFWSRLGLTYDGTNVYRTDDTEQTPLTDAEIISIANEWLTTLSDKDKTVYRVLETPTQEDISCQLPKTVAKTTIIEADTSLSPSNFKGKYIKK